MQVHRKFKFAGCLTTTILRKGHLCIAIVENSCMHAYFKKYLTQYDFFQHCTFAIKKKMYSILKSLFYISDQKMGIKVVRCFKLKICIFFHLLFIRYSKIQKKEKKTQ